MQTSVDALVAKAARVVRSAAPAMPRREEMAQELSDADAAQERGHFLPDEDERIREVFARYLSVRGVLLEAVESIQPILDRQGELNSGNKTEDRHLRTFVIGFAAATILVRSANFMVGLAKDRSAVWKKLDEAEPRYGIQAKSYTAIYKNLSSSRRMWRYHEAMTFYEVHKEDIAELSEDPVIGHLVRLLAKEEAFFEKRKRSYLKKKWDYRLYSFKRRNVSGYKKVMFHLLKLSGSAIAEMKQPFVKGLGQGHRVTVETHSELVSLIRAGDVFITRHDDAMSNLFLPGFWPHAALYIGNQGERDALGVSLPVEDGRCLRDFHFLEAKKDGVLFRPLTETLQVDAFMVLRPKLDESSRAEALNRALTHEGKLYDFIFDFRKADRLACTEVVYRSYHGVGPISFELRRHTGRPCLSAEDLIEQALGSGHFEKIVEFGVDGDVLKRA
ncbi:MAG: YiiX/YebB-like N1pC/P60 family cysteine hydrolase [Akkermansiaceae bacterium]